MSSTEELQAVFLEEVYSMAVAIIDQNTRSSMQMVSQIFDKYGVPFEKNLANFAVENHRNFLSFLRDRGIVDTENDTPDTQRWYVVFSDYGKKITYEGPDVLRARTKFDYMLSKEPRSSCFFHECDKPYKWYCMINKNGTRTVYGFENLDKLDSETKNLRDAALDIHDTFDNNVIALGLTEEIHQGTNPWYVVYYSSGFTLLAYQGPDKNEALRRRSEKNTRNSPFSPHSTNHTNGTSNEPTTPSQATTTSKKQPSHSSIQSTQPP